jgi:phosphopantetheinyl transferase (holo-ACP synthase)
MDKALFRRAARVRQALAIGLDRESADNLPSPGDPWSEPFYVENFTRTEIAWCLCQPDPRLSFCGLWCAKEAALKCGREFAGLRPIEIEILHDPQGRPVLRPRRARPSGRASDWLLSISLAGRMGVAVCVKRPPAPGFRAACESVGDRRSGPRLSSPKMSPFAPPSSATTDGCPAPASARAVACLV